jgi:hypothetical protein
MSPVHTVLSEHGALFSQACYPLLGTTGQLPIRGHPVTRMFQVFPTWLCSLPPVTLIYLFIYNLQRPCTVFSRSCNRANGSVAYLGDKSPICQVPVPVPSHGRSLKFIYWLETMFNSFPSSVVLPEVSW